MLCAGQQQRAAIPCSPMAANLATAPLLQGRMQYMQLRQSLPHMM